MSLQERGALSVNEAAQYLSVGRTTIYQLLRDRKLDSMKLGSRRLIYTSSIQECLQSGRSEAANRQ